MPEVAPRVALVTLVRDCLIEAGFGWEATRQVPDFSYDWPRPPLFSDALLAGIELQPHIAVPMDRGPDDLVNVYEEFIHTALRLEKLRVNPSRWFARRMSWNYRVMDMLFTPGLGRRNLHLNLVQYAALVAYNHEVDIVETNDTFVVTEKKWGFRFGVEGGCLVSNRRKRGGERRCGFLSARGGLLKIARGLPDVPDSPTMYDVTLAWLYRRNREIGVELESLQLALQVLWWRMAGRFPSMLWDLQLKESSLVARRRAVKEARNYMDFTSPYRTLKEIFVPQLMRQNDFFRKFGYNVPYPLTEKTKKRWDEALDYLDPDLHM
jgi:hypothetical protein